MMIERFGFDASSQIIEIASNDGYLLQYFRERGLAVLGIEPASKVAEVARERGIATLECFFNAKTAGQLVAEGKRADLLLGNNVLAHVPELWDFISGMKLLLAPEGIITMEFPHLMRLMESNQFDTIYHEHLSYFSFRVVNDLFERQGLRIFDVEELPTHGGSLRIFARHPEHEAQAVTERVEALLSREEAGGLGKLSHYLSFAPRVEATKRKLLRFLLEAKDQGKAVVGYAAAAKGNTLLNYCGIRTDMLDYVVDRSPHKQGRWLPGTHVPITGPERILETKPDYVLILAWNLKNEIMEDLRFIREWGGRFAFPIPRLEVIE
jgi:SAM-dependent methyltransferase